MNRNGQYFDPIYRPAGENIGQRPPGAVGPRPQDKRARRLRSASLPCTDTAFASGQREGKPLRAAPQAADWWRSSFDFVNPPGDCRRCGVCCFSDLPAFVRVTGGDWTRLGADAERFAHFLANRAFMRMEAGHCAALEVRPSPQGGAEFFCTIYERRPQICRDLGRGSAQCLGELAAKADRVAARCDVLEPPLDAPAIVGRSESPRL